MDDGCNLSLPAFQPLFLKTGIALKEDQPNARAWRAKNPSRISNMHAMLKAEGSDELESGEVLGIHHADGVAGVADDDDVVHPGVLEGGEDFGGELVGADGDGTDRHEVTDSFFSDAGVFLEGADKVAMGEDTGESAIRPSDDGGSAAGLGHFFKGLPHGGLRGDEGDLAAAAHDIAHPCEEGAAEGAAGVKAGEVVGPETSGLQEDHGEGVSHDEHVRGAGGGGEIQRAGFLGDGDVENDISMLSEGGTGSSGDGDDGEGKSLQMGKEVEHLLGLTALAEEDDEVPLVHDAEVSMEGVTDIEINGGGAGAVQGGGEFLSDVSTLADTADDELPFILNATKGKVDGAGESLTDAFPEALEFLDLDVDDATSFFRIIHVTDLRVTPKMGARTAGPGESGTVASHPETFNAEKPCCCQLHR